MTTLQIRLIIYAVLAAGLVYGGWYLRDAKAAKDAQRAAEAAHQARIELARDNERLQKEAQDARNKDQKVYVDRIKTIYRTVPATHCFDVPTRLRLNEGAARATREALGTDEPMPGVPAAGSR